MRLLHTADWHLCDKLGRVDRTPDLRARVEHIAALCEHHHADVLVVAGDVFSEQASLDEMKAALEHLHAAFADFFARDGTLLAVTGNHDRESRVELVRQGMRLATPTGGRELRAGRAYVLNQPFAATLAGVQFLLMPYPTTVRYGLPTDKFLTKDQEHRALNNRVVDWLKDATDALDPKLPTVLVGHLHVAGAGLSHTLFKVTEQDDVIFDTGHLGLHAVQYVALGHIHKPQALPGLPHVRYSGSPDRLAFDERDEDKGVVLVEVGAAGLVGEPTVLPLPATRMHKLVIADPAADLPRLRDIVPDAATTLVHVTATYVPGGPTRDEIVRAVRSAFPRHTALDWAKPAAAGATGGGGAAHADYRAAVRDHLARELATDPDRAALTELAETFLTAEAAS
jgi:exonuclease SbcD